MTKPKAPTSNERSKCWAFRDEYFKCLDSNNKECEEMLLQFKKHCPASWVDHFIKKRDYTKAVERAKTLPIDRRLDELILNK